MWAPVHFGAANSRRTSSPALTLTTTLVSKSWPALRSRYVWVLRAKQLWLTTPSAKVAGAGADVVQREGQLEWLDVDDRQLLVAADADAGRVERSVRHARQVAEAEGGPQVAG